MVLMSCTSWLKICEIITTLGDATCSYKARVILQAGFHVYWFNYNFVTRFLRTNEKHSNRDEGGGSTKPVIKVPSHGHGYLTLKLRGEGTGSCGVKFSLCSRRTIATPNLLPSLISSRVSIRKLIIFLRSWSLEHSWSENKKWAHILNRFIKISKHMYLTIKQWNYNTDINVHFYCTKCKFLTLRKF